MNPSKNGTEFAKWLEESALKGVLRHGGVRLKSLDRIQTEIFVANAIDGHPVCIFEVGCGGRFDSKNNKYLLRKISPWCLKLPGYTVLYEKRGHGDKEIFKFDVRKFTPTERFVGEFSARDFAGFMAATIEFYRKKHEKENIR